MSKFKNNRLYQSIAQPFWLLVVIWSVHLLQWVTSLSFGSLGIFPRSTSGLSGIITAPLIHGDFGHLMANTPPLFVMSALLVFFYRSIARQSFVLIYLLTGLAVWALARPVYHIGASGVVYGLVAFVFWTGIFRRNLKSIVLALLVLFYYGSLFLGIMPGKEGVSWESHLLGALAGIFVAFLYRDKKEADEEKEKASWELEAPDPERNFLDADVFEKTKVERERGQGGWFQNDTWR